MLTRDLRAAETAQQSKVKAKNEAEMIMVEDQLDILRKQRGA
jgi:hypothetical protein